MKMNLVRCSVRIRCLVAVATGQISCTLNSTSAWSQSGPYLKQ